MTEGNWAGHHCKVCYEQAMKEKMRLDALLRAKRNQQLVEPPPRPEPPNPVKKAPSLLLAGRAETAQFMNGIFSMVQLKNTINAGSTSASLITKLALKTKQQTRQGK